MKAYFFFLWRITLNFKFSCFSWLIKFVKCFKSLICISNKNCRYSSLLLVSSILIILASLTPINVLTFPRIPGLCGRSIDKVDVYSFNLPSLSKSLPCQCFLIDARAFPVLLEDNQCNDGETFFDVFISIGSKSERFWNWKIRSNCRTNCKTYMINWSWSRDKASA